uniref:(northern house mosquito) hypothetical protein n=1 Tax=Culex pipiens TaxID=7175 RepID=A0A8D8HBI5_CULPI
MSLMGSHISSVWKRRPLHTSLNAFGSRKYVTEPRLRWLSLVVSFLRFCFWSKLAPLASGGSTSLTSLPITGLSLSRWLPCRMKVIVLCFSVAVYPGGSSNRANTVNTTKFPLNNFSGIVSCGFSSFG